MQNWIAARQSVNWAIRPGLMDVNETLLNLNDRNRFGLAINNYWHSQSIIDRISNQRRCRFGLAAFARVWWFRWCCCCCCCIDVLLRLLLAGAMALCENSAQHKIRPSLSQSVDVCSVMPSEMFDKMQFSMDFVSILGLVQCLSCVYFCFRFFHALSLSRSFLFSLWFFSRFGWA